MKYPLLYEMNTRVLLRERGQLLGRRGTLDDIPDELLDDLAEKGFEWVWFLGLWQTGEKGKAVSRANPELRQAFLKDLPDVAEEDICGSPFAVQQYVVNRDFGGEEALERLRGRLRTRSLRLVTDFVVNHCALDHPWVSEHPEYFISGTEEDLAREPQNYVRLQTAHGSSIFALGRDPYFAGWPDTLQLNYRHRGSREAMMNELLSIAAKCHGVRCDMAMLVQQDVFQRTWGDRAIPKDRSMLVDEPFWPEAIRRVRGKFPGFLFIAEVYWDLEWQLQQAGFDYTYDKRLYDRLRAGDGRSAREHLLAEPIFQDRSLRFLENHDEPRAASVFSPAAHRAAAIITYLVPGMRFFHEGQFDGRKAFASMHLSRRPDEFVDPKLELFYGALLKLLHRSEAHDGTWSLWRCSEAWDGNPTWQQFVVFSWQSGDDILLATVNYGPSAGQCYASASIAHFADARWTLTDLLSEARYERDGDDLVGTGLYLDMPAFGYHVFQIETVARRSADKIAAK